MRTRVRSVVATVALLLGTGLSACSSDESYDPSAAGNTDQGRQTRLAASTVADLQRALREGDGAAAGAVGSGAVRQSLRTAVANVRALGIAPPALRFVETTALSGDDLAEFGPDAWRGTVEIRYRVTAWDRAEATLETPMIFVPGGEGALIAAVGGEGGRTPLWLRGPVTVRESDRALVVVRSGDADRYAALARRALVDVARVLPEWRGRLVIEIPATEEELDEALGAPPGQYDNIAAVTAAVDGSLVPGTPVRVFVNPRVFDGLGPRGAQVVISHESTHVATEATFAQMPVWLLEGFADYVALADAGVPVRTAASQILARVRRQGPPERLPTPEDLAPTANGLGATYEEAWLATRHIARLYGEPKLVAFYRAVDEGANASAAFRDVLGTTEAAFVRSWSADLDALAGGEPG